MEFEAISSGPLLDNKNDWCPTDGAWADVALQKAERSIDSESSCTCTDVGSPTTDDSTVWESLCTEWSSQKATEAGAEDAEASTPPNHDPLSTPPYDQLFLDAEQEGLWYATHRTAPHTTASLTAFGLWLLAGISRLGVARTRTTAHPHPKSSAMASMATIWLLSWGATSRSSIWASKPTTSLSSTRHRRRHPLRRSRRMHNC